jgi:pilus assembly protein CpaE
MVDMARQSHRLDAALLESSVLVARGNLHVLAAPVLPYKTEEVTPQALQNILALARTEYDFVFVDAGRTLDPTTVKALDLAEHIYMVLHLSLPAIQDAKRMLTVFQGLGYAQDKINMVVNRHQKQGTIRLEEVETVTKAKVARTIPASDEAVMASINQGTPLQKLSPRDAVARALQDWANDLSPLAVKRDRGWLATLAGTFSN